MSLPEPDASVVDPVARIVDYLDFFRAEVRRKTSGLPDEAVRQQAVPSGWSLAGLVEHLVHMERRWTVWGFLGEDLPDPRGDRDEAGRFVTTRPFDDILDDLDAGGRTTREIVARHAPTEQAAVGGKFAPGDELPTLMSILFHVMQEYARHAGHLDIARELIDGLTGEA